MDSGFFVLPAVDGGITSTHVCQCGCEPYFVLQAHDQQLFTFWYHMRHRQIWTRRRWWNWPWWYWGWGWRGGGVSQSEAEALRTGEHFQVRRCVNCDVIDRNSPNWNRGQIVKDMVDWRRQQQPRAETIKINVNQSLSFYFSAAWVCEEWLHSFCEFWEVKI